LQARDEPLPLRFSDGSSVELGPKTSSRIAELDAQGARIVVERGRAVVHVAKRSGAHWRFLAGPLVVDVTGTRFELAWSPDDEQATLTMREGSVDIAGCGVVGKRSVRAPEALQLDCKQGQAPQPVVVTTATPSPETTKAPTVNEPPPARPAEPPWQSLARAGKYAEARALVEASGFQEQLRTAEASDLLLLGDVARYTGRAAEAARVYQQVRQRFPNSDSSALAAFALGRLAFDQKSAYAEAASQFQTYVRERPRGSFALEARGRRIEALHRAGDAAGARAAAGEYLRLYPNGPHAAQARKLLGAP
jgi:transmembrane sensor